MCVAEGYKFCLGVCNLSLETSPTPLNIGEKNKTSKIRRTFAI